MHLRGYDSSYMNTTKLSNKTYILTAQLNHASGPSGTDVMCEVGTIDYGACAYIGYPPGDKELQCETRNLESVDCHWEVGRDTHLWKSPTTYTLLGRPCVEPTCSQTVQVGVGERKWTLTATNPLGKVELVDIADLTKRVHMWAPERVVASTVNARNVSLEWAWNVTRYYTLSVKCQVNISHGETYTTSEHTGVGLHSAVVVNDLIPNWTYDVTVRCGTAHDFWKWSDWSIKVNFHTRSDVPDALDVWMQTNENQSGIMISWKMLLASQSHGDISDYAVSWAQSTEGGGRNTTTVGPMTHSLALNLDTTEGWMVTVTARNINGSSPPSTITIPSLHPDRTRVKIYGSNGSFSLRWSASPAASCGYTVDWCPTIGNCSVEWIRVPPNQTNATIVSKNFKDGLRYTLSVYACTQGAPVLLERREGYVRQQRIADGLFKSLKWKQMDSDVEVSWDLIPLREQTAFITGYVLYGWNDTNNMVVNVSTDDPVATSLTARRLNIGSYTFRVKAKTAAGECGTSTITATLNSLSDNLIQIVLISLLTVFGLLSIITVLCYRHWTCIKWTVYPPIPKPVLTNKWLASMGEGSSRLLHVDQCHHIQTDVLDVLEQLHCNSEAPVNGYIRGENMPWVFTQTPKGYYNQPIKKCVPPPAITLPTKAFPSQSPSPFRGVIANPPYNNLMMQTLNQQSGPVEGCSDGYQPHSPTETLPVNPKEEGPDTPMFCVLTYHFVTPTFPDSC